MNTEYFYKNLARLRKERALTQTELAKSTGLTQRVLSSYENNKTQPTIENAISIAKALKVNLDELIKTDAENLNQGDYLQLDARTMEKIKLILQLPRNERHIIYTIAESFIAKRKLEQRGKQS